jgi:hypothetical protein
MAIGINQLTNSSYGLNQIGGGLYSYQQTQYTVRSNPLGQGIFDYLGKARNRLARQNPVFGSGSQPLSDTTDPATLINNISRTVRVWVNSSSSGTLSPEAWTDNQTVGSPTQPPTIENTNNLVYDFNPGFGAGITINNKVVSNASVIKLSSVMLHNNFNGVIPAVQFRLFGSTDGVNWDLITEQNRPSQSTAIGWIDFPFSSNRFYRFLRFAGGTSGGQISGGTFTELDLFGTIKFLQTSNNRQ